VFCYFRYAGRPPAAAVATGSKKIHNNEQEAFIKDAFNLE
jgi:2-oxoglutarate dehydrogenase complex dehydrogenase (E1) component-like enzyme